jgi:hypothetical protein
MNRRSFLAALGSAPLVTTFAQPILRSLASEPSASHPFTASMWTYLWDLADEGYAQAFGRMKENGLTSVSLACAYHAGKFLAPHNPRRKVVFLEDGTVYFAPTASKYGRIQPKINSLVGEGHSLATVRRESEKAGLETRAWVVCCHNTPMGTSCTTISVRAMRMYGHISGASSPISRHKGRQSSNSRRCSSKDTRTDFTTSVRELCSRRLRDFFLVYASARRADGVLQAALTGLTCCESLCA